MPHSSRFAQMVRRLFRKHHSPRTAHDSRCRRLTVEELETRLLLSAAVSPDRFVGSLYKELLDRPAAAYRDVLGRSIEADGLVYFGQVMSQGGLAAAANVIASSGEATGRLVQQAYQQYLQRPADRGGLQYWTAVVQNTGYDALVAG